MANLRELSAAGEDGARWLARAREDADLSALRERPDWGALLFAPDRPVDPALAGPGAGTLAPFGPILLADLPAPQIPSETRYSAIRTPWPVLQALLVRTEAVSFGTRRGFQPRSSDAYGLDDAPAAFLRGGVDNLFRPGWWSPAPNVAFLVIPYELPGMNGGQSLALYAPATGGAQIVHAPPPTATQCDGISHVVLTRAKDEIRTLAGCWEESGEYCHLRFDGGVLRSWCENLPLTR